jgi:hypothetical protein
MKITELKNGNYRFKWEAVRKHPDSEYLTSNNYRVKLFVDKNEAEDTIRELLCDVNYLQDELKKYRRKVKYYEE